MRGSTEGGDGDPKARGGSGVCPAATSCGAGGGIDERGTRTGATAAPVGEVDGTGVGLRNACIAGGVGLRVADGGSGVVRPSALGGTVDLREPGDADGGSGVIRLSGGGIVDLREVGDADGGCGVMRLSGGGIVGVRRDEGSSVERDAPASSSLLPKVSPLLGSSAGVFKDERREGPRAAPSGVEASGGLFPIVTKLTLVDFSQRVRCSRY
ncbi:MAG: hypothetical protein IPM54_05630 [Polyangiaceae bacterium]|nr:hypothetical protein [Polyangiaceae bacterium]